MDNTESFPLTEIQYAYWVGRGPNFVLGNVAPHAYFELDGKRLDPDLLTTAWRRLVARHEMLRAVVGDDGRQRILDDVPEYEIACVDLRDAEPAEVDDRLDEIRAEMSHHVYPATTWPLFGLRLTRLPDHDRLHISLDLLMVDLASVAVLFSEWALLCQHPETVLAPIETSFREYVEALEEAHTGSRYLSALDYWTGRADTLAPPPDLPLAKSPASVRKPVFTHREYRLRPDLWQRFADRARARGLTPTAVLATAFGEVLALWSGTERFTLNLTLFNRLPLVLTDDGRGHRMAHPHLRDVVGDFTSICLLEVDTTGADGFVDKVGRTQSQLQQDLRHRYASALHTLRERRRRGLQTGFETIPVVFTSGLGTVADLSGPREYFGDIGYRVSQTPQVWLDHQVVDVTGTLELSWDAIEELFPAGMLDDMFEAYTSLVERLASDDDAWDADLAVALPDRQVASRRRANDTAGPLPAGLLHEPFLAQVPHRPDQPAVISPAGTISYAELEARSAAVATALAGPGRDRLVGIVANKGVDQVVAAYGILRAGAAYLPVAANLPTLRQRQILTDGDAAAIVSGATAREQRWPDGLPRLDLAALPADLDAPDNPARPEDLAYVIYTSGSTGNPKGVMIEHRSALNTVVDINDRYRVTADDRVFGLADLGFDLSVYDLFGTMAAGATLVLPDGDKLNDPAHWAKLMTEHRVSVWNSVPAQMLMLVEHLEAGAEVPPALRVVMLSGDWIPVDLPERIADLWPDAQVFSLGGATEASIWSIAHPTADVEPDAPSVPYGTPLRNQRFHVLDARLRPSPVWVTGELYIEGDGLARGYWGDPDKTAASFPTHPVTGVRLYRTGDYGRYLPDGTLQFLGRRDGQIKINGYRVELGEVEAVLRQHPGVDQSVAVAATGDGPARLVGYVVPTDPPDESLFGVETADRAHNDALWRRLTGLAASAPEEDTAALLEAWRRLDDVHAAAVGTAFRALGMPHRPGRVFDPAHTARGAGVAGRYDRWLRRATAVLTDRGFLRPDPEGSVVVRELPQAIPGPVADAVRASLGGSLGVPDDLTDWLLSLAGGVAGVLTEDLHSAQLYTNDRTTEVYARLFDPTYRIAAAAVAELVAQWPADRPLRILEVGAGYGSLTGHLLPLLPPEATEYVFTDISTYFLGAARTAFTDHPFVRYELYDLDSTPQTQGFDGREFDLVIVASVLHDAKDIGRTMRNLSGVLAPDAVLLMVEQTTFHPWFDLTMGLQQGFDGYEDTALRGAHPLLDRRQWDAVLTTAGYTGTTVLSTGGPAAVGFDVIVARGPAERRRFEPEALKAFVGERLPKHMVPSRIHTLDAVPLSDTGKVDRKALARASVRTAARGRPAKPPRTERQYQLVDIWRETLGLADLDLGDDFLEAGGDSLQAARLVGAIQTRFGVAVPVAVILEYPTVEALDGYLTDLIGPSEPREAS
ncbi:non-ribosomal peptide synthetase [Longispora fulva]|uniref:Phenyloxazoline synthase MbtB n=1 Tax=Longispora fulva TaxID=619741 RepID=A0A8J7GCA1_9ACTN|nr:non-ribosomal peptide synthetase [Longispora fulva]MBG6134951.1 pyochelin synthetase [Longispora fulva]GIG56817.1 non-ribosomal peptide synthetase [Longispora fulva]